MAFVHFRRFAQFAHVLSQSKVWRIVEAVAKSFLQGKEASNQGLALEHCPDAVALNVQRDQLTFLVATDVFRLFQTGQGP